MFKKQLKVGDYIFTARGNLARITKVNKLTYSYDNITEYGTGRIAFNGIKNDKWKYYNEEWFECDNPTAIALKKAFEKWTREENILNEINKMKTLLGKAKGFLEEIKDIKSVEVYEKGE